MIEQINKYLSDNRVGIFTNSFNEELLQMSSSLYADLTCPKFIVPGIRKGKPFYGYECFDYVLSDRKINKQFDYLIYIDEDCFVTDLPRMYNLLKHFIDGNYDFCGVPDGGVITMRHHNPVSINTFFTIFNLKSIRKVYSRRRVRSTQYDPSLYVHVPHLLIKTNDDLSQKLVFDHIEGQIPYEVAFDNFEPYYKIFFYLLKKGCKPLYLNAGDSPLDGGRTTEVHGKDGDVFCYHTWYARFWASDMEHRSRITMVWEHARRLNEGV